MPEWCTVFEHVCKSSGTKRTTPQLNALCRRRPHYYGLSCAVSTNERALPYCQNRVHCIWNACWLPIFGQKKVYLRRIALRMGTTSPSSKKTSDDKIGQCRWFTSDSVKERYFFVKKSHLVGLMTTSPKTANLGTTGKYVWSMVSNLKWCLKGRSAMSEVRYGHFMS